MLHCCIIRNKAFRLLENNQLLGTFHWSTSHVKRFWLFSYNSTAHCVYSFVEWLLHWIISLLFTHILFLPLYLIRGWPVHPASSCIYWRCHSGNTAVVKHSFLQCTNLCCSPCLVLKNYLLFFPSTVSIHQSQGWLGIFELIQMVLLQDMSMVSQWEQWFIVHFCQFKRLSL